MSPHRGGRYEIFLGLFLRFVLLNEHIIAFASIIIITNSNSSFITIYNVKIVSIANN